MSVPKDLWAIVHEQIAEQPDASDDAIAIEAMKAVKTPTRASMVLLPAVRAFVATLRRGEVRQVERQVFPRSARLPPPARRTPMNTTQTRIDATSTIHFHCSHDDGDVSLALRDDPWQVSVYLTGSRDDLLAFAERVREVAAALPELVEAVS